jgi:hypothetical protein
MTGSSYNQVLQIGLLLVINNMLLYLSKGMPGYLLIEINYQ